MWGISVIVLYRLGWHSNEDSFVNIKNGIIGCFVFLVAFGFMRNKKEIYKKNDLIWKALSKIC